jgi:hypothetical protein
MIEAKIASSAGIPISHSVAAEGVAVLVLKALAVSKVDGSFLFS